MKIFVSVLIIIVVGAGLFYIPIDHSIKHERYGGIKITKKYKVKNPGRIQLPPIPKEIENHLPCREVDEFKMEGMVSVKTAEHQSAKLVGLLWEKNKILERKITLTTGNWLLSEKKYIAEGWSTIIVLPMLYMSMLFYWAQKSSKRKDLKKITIDNVLIFLEASFLFSFNIGMELSPFLASGVMLLAVIFFKLFLFLAHIDVWESYDRAVGRSTMSLTLELNAAIFLALFVMLLNGTYGIDLESKIWILVLLGLIQATSIILLWAKKN